MFQRTDGRPIPATRCQFVFPAPTNVRRGCVHGRALFAGEYPPTGSKADAPHDNLTGIAISKSIGLGRHDWIDLVPYAPVDAPSGKIDRRAFEARVRADTALQSDWTSRVAGWVVACGAAGPVVYVAGKLCHDAWTATSHERFQFVYTVSQSLGVQVYKTGSTECLVMLDQPHPSWALVSHGDPSAVESFQRAMLALNALLSDRDERATLNEARLLETMESTERLVRCDLVRFDLLSRIRKSAIRWDAAFFSLLKKRNPVEKNRNERPRLKNEVADQSPNRGYFHRRGACAHDVHRPALGAERHRLHRPNGVCVRSSLSYRVSGHRSQ